MALAPDGDIPLGLVGGEAKGLADLRKMLTPELNARLPDHFILRFLRGRKGDAKEAYTMLSNSLKWRADKKIDDLFPRHGTLMPHYDVTRTTFMWSHHKSDKEGRPIYIERPGSMRIAEFCAMWSSSELEYSHTWVMEYFLVRANEASKALGRRILGLYYILDLGGMNLAHRHLAGIFRLVAPIDQNNYPEAVHKMALINCPSLFTTLHNITKPLIDPVTLSKMKIFGNDFKGELLKDIAPENLPVEYGGTCQCRGGCVPPMLPWTGKETTVAKGAKYQIDYTIPAISSAPPLPPPKEEKMRGEHDGPISYPVSRQSLSFPAPPMPAEIAAAGPPPLVKGKEEDPMAAAVSEAAEESKGARVIGGAAAALGADAGAAGAAGAGAAGEASAVAPVPVAPADAKREEKSEFKEDKREGAGAGGREEEKYFSWWCGIYSHEIEFTLEWHPKGGLPPVVLRAPERITSVIRGSFPISSLRNAAEGGVVRMVFDNSHFHWHSKHIRHDGWVKSHPSW